MKALWLVLLGLMLGVSFAADQINFSITYPINGSTFGPNQCWLNVITNESDNGTSATRTCQAYYLNGSSYVLNQTISANGNGLAFMNFSTGVDTSWVFNCTATVDSIYSNSTPKVNTTFIGSSFCAGGSNDDNVAWDWLSFVILGGGLMILGIREWWG